MPAKVNVVINLYSTHFVIEKIFIIPWPNKAIFKQLIKHYCDLVICLGIPRIITLNLLGSVALEGHAAVDQLTGVESAVSIVIEAYLTRNNHFFPSLNVRAGIR